MKTVMFADGDLFLHQACAATEHKYTFGSEIAIGTNFHQAREIFDSKIQQVRRALEANSVIVALSDPDSNWRKQVLGSYKETRVKRAKPVLFRQLRQDVEERYKCVWFDSLEADDCLGIAATGPKSKTEHRIIVSWDGDLESVPCRLYNPRHPSRGVVTVTEAEADYAHLHQTLTGDAVDNYVGIPGVGPVKAEKILGTLTGRAAWDAVVAAYEAHGLTEADALTQARVARILRYGEWNPDIGVRLFAPESKP